MSFGGFESWDLTGWEELCYIGRWRVGTWNWRQVGEGGGSSRVLGFSRLIFSAEREGGRLGWGRTTCGAVGHEEHVIFEVGLGGRYAVAREDSDGVGVGVGSNCGCVCVREFVMFFCCVCPWIGWWGVVRPAFPIRSHVDRGCPPSLHPLVKLGGRARTHARTAARPLVCASCKTLRLLLNFCNNTKKRLVPRVKQLYCLQKCRERFCFTVIPLLERRTVKKKRGGW